MSSKNKGRREASQSCQGSSATPPPWAMPGMVAPPWGAMWPFPTPFAAGSPALSTDVKAETKAKRPWSSSSSSEDDDFQPSRKSKKKSTTGAKRGRPSNKELAARAAATKEASKPNSGAARAAASGAARAAASAAAPSAETSTGGADSSDMDVVSRYPSTFKGRCEIAFQGKDECKKCTVYVGNVALIPCGHHKFCHVCINKLRETAMKMKRPAKCLNSECYELVKSWVQMFHVNV